MKENGQKLGFVWGSFDSFRPPQKKIGLKSGPWF
jgi:hypothetical protein